MTQLVQLNSREGLEERLAADGSIPGLFHQVANESEFAMRELETHPEGWSFRPQLMTAGLASSARETTAFNESIGASRVHHHFRRMRLELQDGLTPQAVLNNDAGSDEHATQPISAIEFEIPVDRPSAKFTVTPASHGVSPKINSLSLPDDPEAFTTEVTCFHRTTAPPPIPSVTGYPFIHVNDLYITKERMTIISDITSCKNLFDYADSQRIYNQEEGMTSGGFLLSGFDDVEGPFTSRRSESGIDLFDADITFLRTDRAGNYHTYKGRATYNPSLTPVTMPEAVDGYGFATIKRALPDTTLTGAIFMVRASSAEDIMGNS
ncbi:hypothetical protein B9479_006655 [Cryptococcus floricola]|uniref:Uncharacterized protein n=1 Tax=Cryptococcus floricola TaxID=2591691 RepID=A0A5D3AR92_9TREE|nr:hypothetical protein B9479_006655 [Cryptococcus floricola]